MKFRQPSSHSPLSISARSFSGEKPEFQAPQNDRPTGVTPNATACVILIRIAGDRATRCIRPAASRSWWPGVRSFPSENHQAADEHGHGHFFLLYEFAGDISNVFFITAGGRFSPLSIAPARGHRFHPERPFRKGVRFYIRRIDREEDVDHLCNNPIYINNLVTSHFHMSRAGNQFALFL
ncbi:MAG: hypothetical protein JXQ27_03000 [Acidobacteria bacterium]|nr:hypothetical protein [Acidobacteriota bacterium]